MAQKQQTQTRKTIRIPLVGSAQNRETDASKDQRFVNFFPESNKTQINNSNKIFLVKRAGLEVQSSPSSAAVGRGTYYYYGNIYSVFGNQVYKGTSAIQTLTTSTGTVGWAESTGSTKYLFLSDGTDAYTITAAGVIEKVNKTYAARANSTAYSLGAFVIPATDNGYLYKATVAGTTADTIPTWPTIIGNTIMDGGVTWECFSTYGGFPTPHIPTPVFMDGYIFLAKKDSADIYNSDLENPYGWSAANYITAEMFPDNLLGMARQNNNLVALGSTSTEFLYDAGNSSGSPLARNSAAVQQFGTCAPYATFQNEKFCIVVGQSSSGGRCVWQIDGTTPKRISTEYIEKLIDAEDGTMYACTSFGVRTQGHFFFVLTLDTMNRTLVYDIEEKMWHEWSSGTDKFSCKYAADQGSGFVTLQHATDGKLYNLKPSLYTDAGVAIQCTATTAKLDFDSMHRKTLAEVWLVGDMATTASSISYRWTDDDYQTWSNYHTMDLSKRTVEYRNGQFRRRAYQFKYTEALPCRIESVEFTIRMGQH